MNLPVPHVSPDLLTGSPAGRVVVSDPAGYLAAVPYLLGFAPTRSLVAAGLGADGGVTVVCRADLPTPDVDPPQGAPPHGDPPHEDPTEGAPRSAGAARGSPAGLAAAVVTALRRTGAVAAVVSTHDDSDPPAAAPRCLAVTAEALGAAGLAVVDTVQAGPRRWLGRSCTAADCGAAGHPTAAARDHPAAAALVLAGLAPAGSRVDVEPCPPPAPAAERAIAADAADAWRAARPSRTGRARRREDTALVRAWRRCLDAGDLDPALAGTIAAATGDRLLRDALTMACLPVGVAGAQRLLRGDVTVLDESLADPCCAGAHLASSETWRRVASLAPEADLAGVEAAHAWLCWAAGAGVAAEALTRRALARDPAQSLAALVRQCLAHCLPPPWACRAAA